MVWKPESTKFFSSSHPAFHNSISGNSPKLGIQITPVVWQAHTNSAGSDDKGFRVADFPHGILTLRRSCEYDVLRCVGSVKESWKHLHRLLWVVPFSPPLFASTNEKLDYPINDYDEVFLTMESDPNSMWETISFIRVYCIRWYTTW